MVHDGFVLVINCSLESMGFVCRFNRYVKGRSSHWVIFVYSDLQDFLSLRLLPLRFRQRPLADTDMHVSIIFQQKIVKCSQDSRDNRRYQCMSPIWTS